MASRFRGRTDLHVEGKDDQFAIANLLDQRAFQQKIEPRDVEIKDAEKHHFGYGRTELLKAIKTASESARDKAVAFVIDADQDFDTTWQAVRNRLLQVQHLAPLVPSAFPEDGLILDVAIVNARVGVWIMPDNSSPGILEDFLQKLIKESDGLIQHAAASTDTATQLGALFPADARSKAIIHAWLAWQAKPGCPLGIAIKSHYFDHANPMAVTFTNWVQRLID